MLTDTSYINYKTGFFDPDDFLDTLETLYNGIDSSYKPIFALWLKSALVQDQIFFKGLKRDYKSDKIRGFYEKIVRETVSKFGLVDAHIRDCFGKEVEYCFLDEKLELIDVMPEFTETGIITELIDLSEKLTYEEKGNKLSHLSYNIQTKTGNKIIRLEEFDMIRFTIL